MGSATLNWVYRTALAALPQDQPASVVAWAEQNVRIVGSTLTEVFDRRTRPWLNEPIECAARPGRYTLIKPVQGGGGTTAGEVILCYWVSNWNVGDIGYFWPNDLKALDRWDKYTNKRLRACAQLMERASPDADDWCRGLILFPHLNFAQLGVRTGRNVSSDTLRGVINEELHDAQGGWEAGKLAQVYGRQRAVWNAVAFNISNASRIGDELHTAHTGATMEEWEVLCPGCKKFHAMRTRWEDDKPQLGGLRYSAESCRRADGTYDYSKMQSSIRFQMPCGCAIGDTPKERRALSESGRYGAPQNKGAPPNERSFRLEAVAVHDTSWMDLIKAKHLALRALKRAGDPSLFEVYQREQECIFWDVRSARPEAKPIELSSRVKDRDGMPNRKFRMAAVDYQQGRAELTELPHFWAVIQDFDQDGNALIVYEGKSGSEGELLDALRRHQVKPMAVVVDASFAGAERYVYSLCLRFGWNAIKIMGDRAGQPHLFTHADGVRRVWSEPEPLWPHLPSQPGPVNSDPDCEPEFWLASQAGAMNALAHARASTERRYEIPADVSEDFKEHFKAWNMEEQRVAQTNEVMLRWKKINDRAPDHLFMCCTYLAVWAERLGIVGASLPVAVLPEPEPPPSYDGSLQPGFSAPFDVR